MIEMLNCDCMEYMAGLPDKAFDLAIVDPPYGDGGGGQWDNSKTGRFGGRFSRYSIAKSIMRSGEDSAGTTDGRDLVGEISDDGRPP